MNHLSCCLYLFRDVSKSWRKWKEEQEKKKNEKNGWNRSGRRVQVDRRWSAPRPRCTEEHVAVGKTYLRHPAPVPLPFSCPSCGSDPPTVAVAACITGWTFNIWPATSVINAPVASCSVSSEPTYGAYDPVAGLGPPAGPPCSTRPLDRGLTGPRDPSGVAEERAHTVAVDVTRHSETAPRPRRPSTHPSTSYVFLLASGLINMCSRDNVFLSDDTGWREFSPRFQRRSTDDTFHSYELIRSNRIVRDVWENSHFEFEENIFQRWSD